MKKILKTIFLSATYYISGFIPKNKNIVVCGAWNGDRVSDNPKAIFDLLQKNSKLKCYWISNKETIEMYSDFLNKDSFINRNSLKGLYILSRAKYVFVSHSYRDVSSINLTRNAISVQLWHGFPIKKIVADVENDPGNKSYFYEKYDWFLSSSSIEDKRVKTAFKYWGINEKNILKFGNPRNDIFLDLEKRYQVNEEFRAYFGIPEGATVVLYMPTFRDKTKAYFSFSNLDNKLKNELKKNNIYILEKQHYVNESNIVKVEEEFGNIIMVENTFDTQELLIFGDVLITDFSSIYMDFIIQKKPVIHFVYDGNEYIDYHRGTYGSFSEECAGPIIENIEELIDFLIKNKDIYFYEEQNKKAFLISNEYNQKNNAAKIIEFLMRDDDIE